NQELPNLHKRVPNYSLLNAYFRPMFLKCQNFYTLGDEEYFTKTGYFTWRVSDCEELLRVTHR
ncbi:MAG: hypothetical protein DSY93_04550, partial [SAR324 cluster bacterium]